MSNILIAVVDDDAAVRLSTCTLLERAGFGVKSFKNGDDFLSRPITEQMACILLDLQMPGSDGLSVLRILGERGDSPPILVVTAHGDIAAAVEAMKLGAFDFMEKPYEVSSLMAAIESALASGRKSRSILSARSDAAARVASLSQRQRQVLQGVLKGLPNKLIAYELGLSIRTIEAYRSQLLMKLGVRGTAEAVRLALVAGLPDDVLAS